ncbi:Uncharacterised protein [uncultured archaeon]|nr:Uncharacterised protein [uncultured archaeon]
MCKQCELKPVYEFTNKRKVCGNCFINYFNKKVLYTIRKFKMADHTSLIFLKRSEEFREIVLGDVLKMFVSKSGAQLVKKKTKNCLIAVGDSTDLIAERIINSMFEGSLEKLNNVKPVEAKVIRPLYLMLDTEILLYAKLKKLRFNITKRKESKFEYFTKSMEEKHPELKHSVVNSYLELFI